MDDYDDHRGTSPNLREKAEALVRKWVPEPETVASLSLIEIQQLLHELRVHQIELEMQNEELRRAQVLLSEARDKYSDLYDFAPVGYFTLNNHGTILEANLTGALLLKRERSLVVGKRFQRFLLKESAVPFKLYLRDVFENNMQKRCEVRLSRSDGSWFDAQLESVAIEDAQHQENRCRTIVSDISERKRAEEALRLSEMERHKSALLLQEVFDGVPDPMIILDSERLIRVINKAARKYFGLGESDEVYGRPCYEALCKSSSLCNDWDHSLVVKKAEPVVFERKGAADPERREQVVVYPVSNGGGEGGAILVHIRDITQAKLMERQLAQSEKLAALGLLISGITHEINNPNSFMSFNIPILRDYLLGMMPIVDRYAEVHPDLELFCMKYDDFRQDIFKLLDNMEHGATRINTIVSNLREYVRKRDRVELRWMDLRAVIDKAVTMCRAELRKNITSFEVEVADNLPSIFSDPEALEQIILNLLINAVHASDKPDSWIRLRAKCEQTREPSCLIEVSDNGCGIEEGAREKIFQPFYTTKTSSSGTGLGLYVCYNLAAALGGQIEVDSKPGLGSTFRVLLRGIQQRKR